jgi:hypothetical protein
LRRREPRNRKEGEGREKEREKIAKEERERRRARLNVREETRRSITTPSPSQTVHLSVVINLFQQLLPLPSHQVVVIKSYTVLSIIR